MKVVAVMAAYRKGAFTHPVYTLGIYSIALRFLKYLENATQCGKRMCKNKVASRDKICSSTERFTDLGKLNLPMVVRF